MKRCKKCNSNNEVEEHHTHPKFMDNPTGKGFIINFCKKHHIILHLIIPSILWKFIKESNKPTVIKEVKEFAIKYSQSKDDFKFTEHKKSFESDKDNKQRCPKCKRELDAEDIIENFCNCCKSPLKTKEDGWDEYC